VFYLQLPPSRELEEDASMTWIFMVMLGMITGSIIVERILPQRTKDRLGAVICWCMMAITMSFLTLSAVGLIFVTVTNYIIPLFT
jgi:nucleoside permease NupC